MIPKVIHYCWFGDKGPSSEKLKYIQSWKESNPGYELKLWNEENFDYSKSLFCSLAYKAGLYAFVSDYVRLWAVEKYGGFYLDLDVEVLKEFDPLRNNVCFFGQDEEKKINSGLIFGAVAHEKHVIDLISLYDNLYSKPDDTFKKVTCVTIITEYFKKMGYKSKKRLQKIDGVNIYPMQYFCPLARGNRRPKITVNTYTVHHYDASWAIGDESDRKKTMRHAKIGRILSNLFGDKFVNVLREGKQLFLARK